LLDRHRAGEHLHLADGDFVEAFEALALRQRHMDQFGVHALDVGQHQQLLDAGVIPHIAVQLGIGLAPLAGGLAEQGDIEQVCFAGIGDGGLSGCDGGGNQMRLDGVGVDAVIQLGQRAVEVPCQRQATIFVFFEPLEFLYEVELEFNGNPGGELEGNVLVGVGAAVAASTGREAHRTGFFDPLLGREDEAVQPRLHPNPVEFDGIKTRVVEPLPDSEELHGIAIAQPVADHVVRVIWVLEPGDVGQADRVLPAPRKHGDVGAQNLDGAFSGFAHGVDPSADRAPVSSNARECAMGNAGASPSTRHLDGCMIQRANWFKDT
jgi:hypothetical protein